MFSFTFWSLADVPFSYLVDCCCSWTPSPTQLKPAWPLAFLWRAAGTCWKRLRSSVSRWWEWLFTSPAPAKTCNRPTPMHCQMPAVCLTWGWVLTQKHTGVNDYCAGIKKTFWFLNAFIGVLFFPNKGNTWLFLSRWIWALTWTSWTLVGDLLARRVSSTRYGKHVPRRRGPKHKQTTTLG